MKAEILGVLGNQISWSPSAKCFKLIGACFTVQMDNDPRHDAKEMKSFLKANQEYYAMAKSNTWPEFHWASILLARDKTGGKMAQEQAGTEDDCIRRLAEHHQEWNPMSGNVVDALSLWLTAKHLQPSVKKWECFWYLVCPITFAPFNIGMRIHKLLSFLHLIRM